MYDKTTMIDTLFETLFDAWAEKQVRRSNEEQLKIEELMRFIAGTDDAEDIEFEIGSFGYYIECRAAKMGFYAGFRAARELITGIPCGEAFV